MRTKLIDLLRKTAVRAEKFNDYNFRTYFVNKYTAKLTHMEANPNISVNSEDLANAKM